MMKLILIVLLSAAFFHVANSDVECFFTKIMLKMGSIKPDGSTFKNICQDYKESFDGIRKEIKECEVNKVKVDGLESLVEDLCSKDDIKQEIMSKEKCLREKSALLETTCATQLATQSATTPELKDILKKQCDNRQKVLACVNNDLGKACDAEKVVKRVTDALESALVGWCAEVDGASVNKVFYLSIISGLLFVMMFWKERI